MKDRTVNDPSICEHALAEVTARLAGEPPDAGAEADRSLDAHLESCSGCRREADALRETWSRLEALELDGDEIPSAELRRGFASMLAGYRAGLRDTGRGGDERTAQEERTGTVPQAGSGRRRGRLLRWAAAQPDRAPGRIPLSTGRPRLAAAAAALVAALVLGVFGGWWIGAGGGGRAGFSELDGLRAEVRALHELVALSLLEQPAATDRLRGVSFGARMERPERPVLAALVDRVERDPNVNVRLAAVEALVGAASDPRVREGLLAALETEESPVVQIALADLLLDSDGDEARRAVARLLEDPDLHPDVRRHLAGRLGRAV